MSSTPEYKHRLQVHQLDALLDRIGIDRPYDEVANELRAIDATSPFLDATIFTRLSELVAIVSARCDVPRVYSLFARHVDVMICPPKALICLAFESASFDLFRAANEKHKARGLICDMVAPWKFNRIVELLAKAPACDQPDALRIIDYYFSLLSWKNSTVQENFAIAKAVAANDRAELAYHIFVTHNKKLDHSILSIFITLKAWSCAYRLLSSSKIVEEFLSVNPNMSFEPLYAHFEGSPKFIHFIEKFVSLLPPTLTFHENEQSFVFTYIDVFYRMDYYTKVDNFWCEVKFLNTLYRRYFPIECNILLAEFGLYEELNAIDKDMCDVYARCVYYGASQALQYFITTTRHSLCKNIEIDVPLRDRLQLTHITCFEMLLDLDDAHFDRDGIRRIISCATKIYHRKSVDFLIQRGLKDAQFAAEMLDLSREMCVTTRFDAQLASSVFHMLIARDFNDRVFDLGERVLNFYYSNSYYTTYETILQPMMRIWARAAGLKGNAGRSFIVRLCNIFSPESLVRDAPSVVVEDDRRYIINAIREELPHIAEALRNVWSPSNDHKRRRDE